MHPTIDVDDRGVVLAHLASCARMVLRSNVGVHPRAQVVIGHITQPGNNRFPPHVVPCHLLHKLVCVSGSRLIVEAEFEARLIEELSRVRIGDPLDPDTQMGAIVSAQRHDKILGYIEPGKSDGAVLDAGGDTVSPPDGVFIVPTEFFGVSRDMAIAQDKNFGPVDSIMAFETAEEAISMAVDTDYG